MNTIRKLGLLELSKYSDHLLRLNVDDRYLRFGAQVNDNAIIRHVKTKSKDKKIILAAFDDQLNVIAACELAFILNKNSIFADVAEIGLSVEESHRGKGLGTELFERALIVARNRKVKLFSSYCLTRNGFMMRIAKVHGMHIETDHGSSEGTIQLPTYNASSVFEEMLGEGMAIVENANSLIRNMWLNQK
jgi:RimJ/RimL family protein N-acetyltransferase